MASLCTRHSGKDSHKRQAWYVEALASKTTVPVQHGVTMEMESALGFLLHILVSLNLPTSAQAIHSTIFEPRVVECRCCTLAHRLAQLARERAAGARAALGDPLLHTQVPTQALFGSNTLCPAEGLTWM